VLLLRTIAILIGLGVIASAAGWLLTGQRIWLDRALRLVKVGVLVGFVFFGVLLLERLV
jgi:hypothetical protein